jgi:hypothetical protein
MLSHNIVYDGSNVCRLDLQRHVMINVVEPSIEDRQIFFLLSHQGIKISKIQIKRFVLTPTL